MLHDRQRLPLVPAEHLGILLSTKPNVASADRELLVASQI